MLQLDDFSYCKATDTCCMFETFFCRIPMILTFFNNRNLYSRCGAHTLIIWNHCLSNSNNSHILQNRDLHSRCGAHTQSNWQWRYFFQIVRSRENHKKGLKDNYGRLIDFLSQISKLSYFNLLDLVDFLMHHWFRVSYFDVSTLGVRW